VVLKELSVVDERIELIPTFSSYLIICNCSDILVAKH